MTAREIVLEMLIEVNEQEQLSHQVRKRTLESHAELILYTSMENISL